MTHPDDSDAADGLALDILDDGMLPLDGIAAAAESLDGGPDLASLDIDDLIADGNNEIVVFDDAGGIGIVLQSSQPVIDSGQVDQHVTAAGDDVSGYAFLTFESGLTVFYEPGLNLDIATEIG